MVEKKVYRVKGILIRRKLIQGKRKEGKIVYRRIEIPFNVEIVGTSEKDVLEKIYSVYGGLYKVKRHQIKIESIKEVPLENVEDEQIRKMIMLIENGK